MLVTKHSDDGIDYETHVEARQTGFVSASNIPHGRCERDALDAAFRVFAEVHDTIETMHPTPEDLLYGDDQ